MICHISEVQHHSGLLETSQTATQQQAGSIGTMDQQIQRLGKSVKTLESNTQRQDGVVTTLDGRVQRLRRDVGTLKGQVGWETQDNTTFLGHLERLDMVKEEGKTQKDTNRCIDELVWDVAPLVVWVSTDLEDLVNGGQVFLGSTVWGSR